MSRRRRGSFSGLAPGASMSTAKARRSVTHLTASKNTIFRCHGADAHGGVGFPNLTDDDWLFGGEPETIQTTILGGRVGMMPPFAPALGGDENVKAVVAYVRSLSGHVGDAKLVELGKEKFNT